MASQSEDLLKKFGAWVALVTLLLSAFLTPFLLDNMAGPYALLAVAFALILVKWKAWSIPSEKGGNAFKGLVLVLILACTAGLGYLLWWVWQPHFEITALDTLESDANAYELTDMLIWNQNKLDQYGVGITFTLEVRPSYPGKQRFGKVVAIISGSNGNSLPEKTLWSDFANTSGTQYIQLTLPELLSASGLKENSDPPSNRFRDGDPPFQQAKLTIRVR